MHLLTALLSEGSIIDLDGTFFIQFALFWIAYVVLKKLVFQPIIAVFEAREESIEGARKKARDLEQRSTEQEKEFTAQLRKVRVSAGEEQHKLRAEAKHLEKSILDKVKAETDKELDGARADLNHAAAVVRQEMKAKVPILAKEIASKLLQREVG